MYIMCYPHKLPCVGLGSVLIKAILLDVRGLTSPRISKDHIGWFPTLLRRSPTVQSDKEVALYFSPPVEGPAENQYLYQRSIRLTCMDRAAYRCFLHFLVLSIKRLNSLLARSHYRYSIQSCTLQTTFSLFSHCYPYSYAYLLLSLAYHQLS